MAGMGPPPKPADQRARRNASVAMTRLPRSGRSGRAPAWPLSTDVGLETAIELAKLELRTATEEAEWQTTAKDRAAARRKADRTKQKLAKLQALKRAAGAAEKRIWTALWKTPQATQWERSGWFREVALYARFQAKAEADPDNVSLAAEARQREDRLGLNSLAMLRLRWEIVDDTAAAAGPPPSPRSKQTQSRYSHLKVVGQ